MQTSTPMTAEQAKALATAQLKGRLIKGTVTGGGIAVGSAVADVTLAGAAEAASAVVTAAAESVIVPTVLTAAAVVGGCALIYVGGKRLQKWWRS